MKKECAKCRELKPVVEFYKQARGFTSYCKTCMKEVSRQRVINGRDKQSKIKYEEKHGHFRGGDRKTLSPVERVAYDIYHNLRNRHERMGIVLELDRNDVTQMISDFCRNNYHVLTSKKHPFKPSIDRLDNCKGYTKENCRVCWQIENYAKNTFSDNDVIEFCKRKLGLL